MAERELSETGLMDPDGGAEPAPQAEGGHDQQSAANGAGQKQDGEQKAKSGDADDEVSMAAALLQDLSSMAAAQRDIQKPADKSGDSALDESVEHDDEDEEGEDGEDDEGKDMEDEDDEDEEDEEEDEEGQTQIIEDPMGGVFINVFPEHNRSTLKNLNEQRERGEFCDVTIQVGGRNFSAHKCLLAASCPKLHAMVSNMRPELMNVLHLKDLNAMGFEHVLEYLYTGHLECQTKHIHDVLFVAQYLELHDIAKHYYTQQASRTLMHTLEQQEIHQQADGKPDLLHRLKNLLSETTSGSSLPAKGINIKTEAPDDDLDDDEDNDMGEDPEDSMEHSFDAQGNMVPTSSAPQTQTPPTSGNPTLTAQEKLVQDYMKFLQNMQQEMQKTFAGQMTPVEGVAYTTTRSGRRTRKPVMPQRNELIDGNLGWRGRGRKPGPKSKKYMMDDIDDPPIKRKRGRPRKYKREAADGEEGEEVEEADEGEEIDTGEVDENGEPIKKRKGRKSGPRPFCDKCDRTFKSRINLAKHMKLHETHKSLECPMCQKKFLRRVELTRHMHTEHSTTTFTCTICNTSFTDPFVYKKHMIDQHKVMRPFPCQFPGCQFSTGRLSTLNRHFPIHTGERNFICKKCGKGFAQSGGLRMHIQGCYQKRSYLCDICGAKFNQLQSMKEHRVLHTGEKPFCCADCGSRFSDRTNFKRHRRIHDNIYPYGCTVCGKRFRHSNSFKVHCEKEGHLSEMPKNHPNCGITYSAGQRSPRQKKGFYSRQLFNQQQQQGQQPGQQPQGQQQQQPQAQQPEKPGMVPVSATTSSTVPVAVASESMDMTVGATADQSFMGGKRMQQYEQASTQESFPAAEDQSSRMSLPENQAATNVQQGGNVLPADSQQRNFAYSFLKDIQHGNFFFNKDSSVYREGIPGFPSGRDSVPISGNMFSPFGGAREAAPQNYSTTGRDGMLLNLSPGNGGRDGTPTAQPPPARHTQPHGSSYQEKETLPEADVLRTTAVSMPDRMVATSYHDSRNSNNHVVSMAQDSMSAGTDLRSTEATTVGPQPHAAVHGYPFTYGTYPPPTPQQMQSYAHLSNLTQAAVNQIYGYPGKI